MKRALVWLCWDECFVQEAVESARSAAAIQADRILITDAAGAAYAQNIAEFTSIVSTQIVFGNDLEKSRLIDLIPQGYDTFLYLDTDTRIVGDVTLGFHKAEQHGIAMAPAPNYNLNEFFNFGRLMPQLGVEPADQLMYNAGVIFFHLTAAVREVLERFRDLCATVGAKQDYRWDQPFLTLAFEQLGFTPYVLSPLYNYRSLGEYAVGNIRIWHSHFPPPPDLNIFDHAWPPRRFRDGALLRADAEPRPRLPQGMAYLSLERPGSPRTPEQARFIAADALAIQRMNGSRAANEFLLDQIGTHCSWDNDESYFMESLHYHLGLLHAYAAGPEKMARHLQLSRTMPTGEDDQLFSDHVNVSHVMRTHQLAGIDRGLPPILIACMPRSASATLTHTLGGVLDVPVMHLSAGGFPDRFLVPTWLDVFLAGGAITQDHFGACDFNVDVLRARGARDIFVLVRDPRAAARSQAHFLAQRGGDVGDPLGLRIERECIANFRPWLQGWIDCASNPDLPFRVHWVTYREVCQEPAAVLRKISTILGARSPAMAAYSQRQTIAEVRVHFVTGNDHAWQDEVDHETRERLWSVLTPDMKSLLDLKW